MRISLSGQRASNEKRPFLYTLLSIRGHRDHRLLLRTLIIMCLMRRFCVAECPSVCECKWKEGKESIMCLNTNLTSIPRDLDSNLLIFDFIGNKLLQLNGSAFASVGLTNLQKLHLVRCNIKYIDRHAFMTLKNLVDLDLSENVLTVVPSQTFAPIPDLRELKLNGNPILKIASYAFVNVPRLIRLEIADCRIGYVDPKAFNKLENSLELLRLNRNRLENVKPETFTTLEALHGFDLTENPLNCSCIMRPLKEWIVVRSFTANRMPTCKYPEKNLNKTWDKLRDEDFACLPSVHTPMRTVTAYEGENVTLTCKIGGNPSPEVSWTLRDRVLLNTTFGYSTTNKRSYFIHSLSNNYSNLTILSLEMEDMGEYVCVAENKAGKVIADIALMIEKQPIGTILSEKDVLIGILITAITIIFLCSIILFIRVMYCKHDTQADIESKRRILSEKIEMKRNSANLKRSSSIMPNATVLKTNFDDIANGGQREKQMLNSVSEEDGLKATRPHLKELKDKSNGNMERSQSPGSSIFESHIGEIALQHHVLHKKELPSGKLYTTAMAFMTDDAMMNYSNSASKSTTNMPTGAKKAHYNTMPRNFTSNSRPRKNVSNYPRVSESQSPLLKNKCYGSSSESINSTTGRMANNYDQQGSYQKSSTPMSQRRPKNNDSWAYPSLPSSPDKDKYWTYSNAMTHSTKETPLLNHIYSRKATKNASSHANYASSAPTYSPVTATTKTSAGVLESTLTSTTYDYHATQLERFLDEYRRLQSELTRMKETCEKLSREELTERLLASRNRHYRSRSKLSLVDRPYDATNSFERRYSSRASLHRSLTSKSRSFDRSPLERSVSFVPTQKDSFVKPATSDDVIVPKSILKKKNEAGYYRARTSNPRFYNTTAVAAASSSSSSYQNPQRYVSSTLPTRRGGRIRRFSDSSMDGFYG